MKRLLSLLLCLVLSLSCLTTVSATETDKAAAPEAFAASLRTLHLLEGVGVNTDGTPDFALSNSMTRTEALVMLLRTIGVGEIAKDYSKTHPFSDVPTWADGYVSYAYDKGLTKGISDTEFDADSSASAAVYLTFMLRALGYTEGETADFSWDSPWFLANRCRILPFAVDTNSFLREDAVLVTAAALYAPPKGETAPLWEKLRSKSVFTQAEFNKAFPHTPFSTEQAIAAVLDTVLKERCGVGFSSLKNSNAVAGYRLVSVTEENGSLTYSFFVFLYDTYLNQDNTIFSSQYRQDGRLESLQITVDAKTHTLQSVETVNDLRSRGLTDAAILPPEFTYVGMPYRERLRYQSAIERIARADTTQKLKNGAISYTASAYSDALQKALLYRHETEAVFESDLGTILLTWTHGTPHGSFSSLTFLAKPASPLGEGETRSIPMPRLDHFYRSPTPEIMTFSKDGKTFICTYYLNEDATGMYDGVPVIYAKAGTHTYTFDLQTGETTITHDPTLRSE